MEDSNVQFTGNSLEEHWMPFTQNREFKQNPRLVVKSEGCYMWDHKGGKLLDGSSSLFNVACGHGRIEIADAVYAQLSAERLHAALPDGPPRQLRDGARSRPPYT